MARREQFEALVLGSGNGGMYLARHLGSLGKRTALVERFWIGGACVNANCLPSKNVIWSAKVAHLARHAASFGTRTGPVEVEMTKVRDRKRRMIDRLVSEARQAYEANGVELIMGTARLVEPRTLEVRLNDGGTRLIAGDQLFLNLGTRAAIPKVPGLEAASPMTHIEELEIDHVPPHLVVLGGGFVGLEAAQAFRRFGSRVTIVHHGAHLASREDPDVAEEMRRIFEVEGIESLLSSEPLRVEGRSGVEVRMTVRTPSGERTLDASDLLVTAGRIPNTAAIGLDKAGVALDARGFIRVNERLETTAPQTWAIGECAGSPQFTHVSFDDFRIIRDNLAGGHRTTHDRLIPYCVFTDPPMARVGLSEVEAKQRGIQVRVARLPSSEVLRTRTFDEEQGFMKALVAAASDDILGFMMIGAEAGEVLAVVQTAMIAGLPYPRLREAILTHPTMAEGLGTLLSQVGS